MGFCFEHVARDARAGGVRITDWDVAKHTTSNNIYIHVFIQFHHDLFFFFFFTYFTISTSYEISWAEPFVLKEVVLTVFGQPTNRLFRKLTGCCLNNLLVRRSSLHISSWAIAKQSVSMGDRLSPADVEKMIIFISDVYQTRSSSAPPMTFRCS